MTRRSYVRVTIAACAIYGATIAVPASVSAAPSPYCAKLTKLMSPIAGTSPVGGDGKKMKAMAKALRDSNPPAEVKQAVSDFASGLDDLSSKVGKLKTANDAKNLAKSFGAGSKYQKGLLGIGKFERTCTTG